jgi:hypothetical protein
MKISFDHTQKELKEAISIDGKNLHSIIECTKDDPKQTSRIELIIDLLEKNKNKEGLSPYEEIKIVNSTDFPNEAKIEICMRLGLMHVLHKRTGAVMKALGILSIHDCPSKALEEIFNTEDGVLEGEPEDIRILALCESVGGILAT